MKMQVCRFLGELFPFDVLSCVCFNMYGISLIFNFLVPVICYCIHHSLVAHLSCIMFPMIYTYSFFAVSIQHLFSFCSIILFSCIRWFTRSGWKRTKDDIIVEVTFLRAAYYLFFSTYLAFMVLIEPRPNPLFWCHAWSTMLQSFCPMHCLQKFC